MRLLAFFFVGLVACGSGDPVPWQSGPEASGPKSGGTDSGGRTQTGDDASPKTPADADKTSANGPVDNTNYNTPTVCTSGQTWTLGTTKSANMEPGLACRSCHVTFGQAGTKDFDISGTVYPTAHEPDLCNGVGGTTVVITDANNADHVLTVNSVGNFYHDDGLGFLKFPMPYRAKVVSGNNTREMITPQTNGDCNSCHTEAGTQSAPGRIMAP